MKDLYTKYISDDLPEDQKSEAQKTTESRAERYTDFFKKPLDKIRAKLEEEKAQGNNLKSIGYKALAITYKAISGFAINSAQLDSNKEKGSFLEQVKAEPSISKKALKIFSLLPKIAIETAIETIQFTVRNTIKQPIMTAFRIVATINNTRKYLSAKIKGDHDQAKIEAANIKYQAKKALKGAIATTAIFAIDLAIFASAGITTPGFGVATAIVGHVAEAAHVSSLGKDTIEIATKAVSSKNFKQNTNSLNIPELQKQITTPTERIEAKEKAHNLQNALTSRKSESFQRCNTPFSSEHLQKIKRSNSIS